MNRTNALLATVGILGLTGGCTWSPQRNLSDNGSGGGGGSTQAAGGRRGTGEGGTGIQVDSGPTAPTADANCGAKSHMASRLPPDLLLVFDRSGSMLQDPMTGNNCMPAATCPSKWNQATAAVDMAVASSAASIRWGLKVFSSDGNNCTVTAGATVPIAINNAAAVSGALAAIGPGGSTPTTLAVTRGGDYLATLTTPNPRFLVLVTDGLPTCASGNGNGGDATAAIAAVAAQAARGYGTFVVGIATVNDNTAVTTLTEMSANGMHPRAGTPNYYVVNNTAELVNALGSIGTQVASCTFTLDSAPPDPTNVRVLGDGNLVPANDVNGWVYEPGMQAITLRGTYCDDVLAQPARIQDVVVLFGCVGVPIP